MSSKLLALLLLLPALTVASSHAGFSASAQGDLRLSIVASDSPEFISKWLGSPSSEPVTIRRVQTIEWERLAVFGFFVSGLTLNEDSQYDFAVSVYILDPDGEPIFGQRDYAQGKGVLGDDPMIVLGDPALDITFESSDPLGAYTVVGQVVDLVSGNTADDRYKLELVSDDL